MMIAGIVTVDPTGNASGAGLAKEIFDDYVPKFAGIPAGPTGAQAKQQLADLCNSIATKTVAHITANAVVTVAASIPVTTAGSATAQTGMTTAPGVGTVA